METVSGWFWLLEYLFKYSKAVKVHGDRVYVFLFADFGQFDHFRECAHSLMFPYCYSTTMVEEYEVTVDLPDICRRVLQNLGVPFIKIPKRK